MEFHLSVINQQQQQQASSGGGDKQQQLPQRVGGPLSKLELVELCGPI